MFGRFFRGALFFYVNANYAKKALFIGRSTKNWCFSHKALTFHILVVKQAGFQASACFEFSRQNIILPYELPMSYLFTTLDYLSTIPNNYLLPAYQQFILIIFAEMIPGIKR